MAGTNQPTPNLRLASVSAALRVSRINSPFQACSNLSRSMARGRDSSGSWTSTLSAATWASTKKPPSFRRPMAGSGVRSRRSHEVRTRRALTPNPLAQRSSSAGSIARLLRPYSCFNPSREAAMPRKRRISASDTRPVSGFAASAAEGWVAVSVMAAGISERVDVL
jgi:hypothetical protein